MDVIHLPKWKTFFFLNENRRNIVSRWLVEQDAPSSDWAILQSLIDLYEHNGMPAIAAAVIDIGNGFWGLIAKNKSGINPCLIFREGPWGENEITFLACARWFGKKRLKPLYAPGIAEENLETLQADRNRRKVDRIRYPSRP